MVSMTEARRLALALPEAVEADHHGRPSFRVRNKIFVTVPDDEHVRVLLDPDFARALASGHPALEELWWGKTLAGLTVTLAAIERDALAELFERAWRRRAPRALVEQRES